MMIRVVQSRLHSNTHSVIKKKAAVVQAMSTGGDTGSSSLWRDICSTYDQAQEKGASRFTETRTEIYQDESFDYILKIARNLRDKPKAKTKEKEWKNPFLPPDQDLFVCQLSDTHSLVLNKFNITPHHVIIITNEFVEQEEPLTREDIAATWEVVQGMPGPGGMAFFNCGSISGASQPHKHIQCVPMPLAYMDDSVSVEPPFESVICQSLEKSCATDGSVMEVEKLPFIHGIVAIHPHMTIDDIHKAYVDILAYLKTRLEGRGWDGDVGDSYNLILTQKYIMIAPRSREYIESVSCNSMGFAGSFFLARQEEIDEMKRLGPTHVLSQLGFSK
mmetsp:Transcript_4242/g.8497  ORF Transcript_4242/g.8497 Transcript_4242/m.8497 type:complete len:332 (+) Transcript_4242:123-1118(+)